MQRLAKRFGAGVLTIGVIGGAIIASPALSASSTESRTIAFEPATEIADVAPALSCDTVRELDRSANERAVNAGTTVPGPEQYPPWSPGFEPHAPPPAESPIDPTTGLPKGFGQAALAPDSEARRVPTTIEVGARPCGSVVEKIRNGRDSGGSWVCYLEDGRYASTLSVDAPEPVTSQKERDDLCRHFGFARSVQ